MKIALIGYGKMGKAIEQVALARGHDICAKFASGGIDELQLQQADIAIEFSRPEAAFGNLQICIKLGVPVVCGTTGWLEQYEDILKFCESSDGSFIYASNYSIGVNVFFAVNRYLAALMNTQTQYEVEVEEIHHTQKIDAPSGTAISIANDIISALSRKSSWVPGEATLDTEIPIFSIRKDPAPGTHLVSYKSEIDTIDIVHTAHSRTGFATGAVIAAEWLKGKRGVFSMKDLLGF